MNYDIRVKLLKFAKSFAKELNEYIKKNSDIDLEIDSFRIVDTPNSIHIIMYSDFLKDNTDFSNSPENEVSVRIYVNGFIRDNNLDSYLYCFNGNEQGTIKIMLKKFAMEKLFK